MRSTSKDVVAEIHNLNRAKMVATIRPNYTFFDNASKRLKPYKSLPYYTKTVMEKLGDYLRTESIPRVFKEEGPGWAPLAALTRAQRAEAGYGASHPILVRSGDLFKELTQKSHPKHVEMIKTGKYARLEIGGSTVKFLENQMGRRDMNLPARSMIPGTGGIELSDKDRKAMSKIAMNTLIARMKR